MQKRVLFVVVCLLLSGRLLAQTTSENTNGRPSNGRPTIGQPSARITGTVRSDKGEAIPGVNVIIQGQQRGTVTDANGQYSIEAGPGQLLIFSSIGYEGGQARVEEVGGSTKLNVTLRESSAQLGEVIVVGYGTQERKNLIGSVTKIDPSETKSIPVGSFDQQLQGKVPGVQISSATGVPGERTNIRVRGATSINGSNDPLYVVDGVFINGNSLQTIGTGGKATSPIADLNPADIESIEILKDAEATALYGSRGANGVILVTTKRGNFGQKPTISVNASVGAARAAKLWDLTTGPQHAELVNEWWINTGKDTPSLNRTFSNRPFRPVAEGGRGLPEEQKTYDRLSELFRTARLQNYDIALSGGTQTTKYYIGAGFNSQEAIIRPITFDRANFKVNLDQQVSDKVQIGVSNTFSRTYRNQARAGDGPAGGLLQAALHTPTYLSPVNEQGVLVGRAGFDNLTLLLQNYDVNTTSLRYIGNLYADAELLPGLKFRSSWGIDYNNYNESEYWNSLLISGSPNGLATSSVSQFTTWLNEQTLSYRVRIGARHNVGLLVGNTLQSDVLTRTYAEGRGFANNDFTQISSAATTAASQSWSKNTLASFFGRANYNFGGKYLFDVSLRADGSSRFGTDRKWGYFPAIGAAWRIKQEPFLQNVSLISDLKLRGSWGVTGNQNGIGNFAAQGLWTGGTGYQGNPGISPQQLGNPDLQWERTGQSSLGLDLGLLNERVRFELNLYRKLTTNGLIQLALPATTGFSQYWSNAAEISNRGFELSLSTVNVQRGNLTWSTSFNIARNVNRIERLPNPLRYGSRDLILQQEGSPLYSFWVYKQLYVDPQTGNAVYDDVNKDGQITVADRQLLGSIWPKFFGGLTNNLTYKGFDVNLFFAFQYGNQIYNHNRFFGEGGGARDAARIIFASNLVRWQKPGDVTDVPRTDGINVNNYRDGGSRWLEDGSFLRLRSLTVGYTLPKELTTKVGLQNLRIYAVGTNLWLLTRYTGLDPESSASSDPNAQGIDLGTPPQPIGIQGGISLTF
ncbi:SusC/RagA family TonB-linked outer membrane protein [Rudanella lutea]|uniref:SusC/RagA family TonB-linked outer membrane protein n=1 Tax=Rudanella lutea TaxID=451374 RepID=UPI0003692A3D|nr:TonB-dependent receptor [Rudanella lutea]